MAADMYKRIHAERRRRYAKILGHLLLAAGLCYGCKAGWEYITQPGLELGQVQVHGTTLLQEQDIARMAKTQVPLNLLNMHMDSLRLGLSQDIRFADSRVEYAFPDELHIYVEERTPAVYIATDYEGYVKVDYSGMVLDVTRGIPDGRAPLLNGVSCGNLYTGDMLEHKGVLQLLQFMQELSPQARKEIAEVHFNGQGEVRILRRNTFPFILGSPEELQTKSQLYMVLYNEIKDRRIEAEYIDLSYTKPYIRLMEQKQQK